MLSSDEKTWRGTADRVTLGWAQCIDRDDGKPGVTHTGHFGTLPNLIFTPYMLGYHELAL